MTKPSEDPYINLRSAHGEHTCIVGATPSAHPMPLGENRAGGMQRREGVSSERIGFQGKSQNVCRCYCTNLSSFYLTSEFWMEKLLDGLKPSCIVVFPNYYIIRTNLYVYKTCLTSFWWLACSLLNKIFCRFGSQNWTIEALKPMCEYQKMCFIEV